MSELFVNPETMNSNYIIIDNIKLHYLEAGKGEVVLMLHGFPTSSHLWRNVMLPIADSHRVIALDLPGYGWSEKPLTASYSFKYYARILSEFLYQLDINEVNLVVHDLGGPVGLLWAVQHPKLVKRLALLNTLVYAKFSWGVILFGIAIKLPGVKNWLSSPSGIAAAIRFGMEHKQKLNEDIIANYKAPFIEKKARKALLKTASNLSLKGFKEIEEKLPLFKIPVRAIYGVNDKILPKVKETMERVKKDLPQTVITAIPNCGHFLQEDEPELVGKLLSEFLNE
ncbi:alpha/beta fold hydrolase [Aureispira anguillae]|uniref:Alpha/beta fold hydrolase n=1 Tax=Aureispira anguillae TaxID=2864201 RepID=A0A915YLD0_9BACT|nr:alpha/beta fold hydrolase [Aureispira anguillae]BDS15343.1 alpha/beta fold hydrolase [Aureispira anguillae]